MKIYWVAIKIVAIGFKKTSMQQKKSGCKRFTKRWNKYNSNSRYHMKKTSRKAKFLYTEKSTVNHIVDI
jgi:hypothetical protein